MSSTNTTAAAAAAASSLSSANTNSRQQQQQRRRSGAGAGAALTNVEQQPATTTTAVPTLRVMRLQSPALHHQQQATTTSLLDFNLRTSMCLPDSLTVHVGETFTAYLGILNTSHTQTIHKLTVHAQLQTPHQRFQLPSSNLDAGNLTGGVDLKPDCGIDAIVSRQIEEPGQHILRIEVGYQQTQQNNTIAANDGTTASTASNAANKTFRKFYRFHVTSPLQILTANNNVVMRVGDARCFVNIHVQYNTKQNTDEKSESVKQQQQDNNNNSTILTISSATMETPIGLEATNVGTKSPLFQSTPNSADKEQDDDNIVLTRKNNNNAVDLFDSVLTMYPGDSFSYLFEIKAISKDAVLRGIANNDYLGRAKLTWRKSMGETGIIYSNSIHCPKSEPVFDIRRISSSGVMRQQQQQRMTCSDFIVHRSGLSVDQAALAGSDATTKDLTNNPVTVEPIDPPPRMTLHVPIKVQFLVVNHSSQSLNLQLQFHLEYMEFVKVCGNSFINLGQISGNGGSTVTVVKFLPLAAGLAKIDGCSIVDLVSGREMIQPPLFSVFVDKK